MRGSRPLPIETVVGLVLVALAVVAGLAVVVHKGVGPDESVLATRADTLPGAPATTVPDRDSAGDPDDDPDDDAAGDPDDDGGAGPAASTTTPAPAEPAPTTTVAPTTTTSTTAPGQETAPVPCPDLQSETYWVETGDRSELRAPAGTEATYVEIVTNRSDETCRFETNRCGRTAVLRTADGAPTDAPELGCPAFSREAALRPGESRREELQVRFPVPPGDYRALVRGYDGVEVLLPVRLDGRLPACDPVGLEIANGGGEQLVEGDDVRERGFDLQLVVAGAADGCTVRTAETRFELTGEDRVVELVDETERWTAPTDGGDVFTHGVAPATDLTPGWYDLTVTVVLAGGDEIDAPFRVLVV